MTDNGENKAKQEQARKEFERALENLIEVGEYLPDDSIISGWVLVGCGIKYLSDDENGTEYTRNDNFYLTSHGQQPVMTRGILEEFVDFWKTMGRLNGCTCNGDDDD